LLDRIVSNGVNTVIVEDASRFARTLMVQEAGIAMLVGLGVRVMTSRSDDLTDSADEMRVAMRQIVGVFSQLEKTSLLKKVKAARDRKRATVDGCGEEHFAGAERFGRLVFVGLVSSDNQDETCSEVGWRREGVARPTAAHPRLRVMRRAKGL